MNIRNIPRYFGAWLICPVLLLFVSCEKELDIKQNYEYEVRMQKYRTDATVGTPVELVFFIDNKGAYTGTTYTVNYFLRKGAGTLTDSKGSVLENNRQYEVKAGSLKIYYTPASGKGNSHLIETEFSNNFNRKKEVTIELETE